GTIVTPYERPAEERDSVAVPNGGAELDKSARHIEPVIAVPFRRYHMQARNADLRCTLCKSRDKPLADPLTAPAGRQIDVQVCWVLPRQMREFGEIGDVRKKRIAGGI